MKRREKEALVLVTRPQESGATLAARLRAAGRDAIWWPAFDLLPPEDPQGLRDAIARLIEFDLAIFVSPAAVHSFAAEFRRLYGSTDRYIWPATTRIAAVGVATRDAAMVSLPGALYEYIICPAGDTAAEGGSDALISAIKTLGARPRSVLLVRAQSGRERLVRWLQGQGASVAQAVAYRRVAHVPTDAQWSALRAGIGAGERLAVLYTSSEAVAVLAAQFDCEVELADTLSDSIALCIHERIERQLRARGRTDVRRCSLEVESIQQALHDRVDPAGSALPVDLLL